MTDLPTSLADMIPGAVVRELDRGSLQALIPNPRWAHDYLSITVERSGEGWLLSDSGEVVSLVGSDELRSMVRLLECAGGDLSVTGAGLVTSNVDPGDSLPERIMTFAHLLIASPVLWHARHCLDDDIVTVQRPGSAVTLLARRTKTAVLERLGERVAPVMHISRVVGGRGETVRMPLVVAPLGDTSSIPDLVASFVDYEASDSSVTSAKRLAAFAFDVVAELQIPKFLVVRGTAEQVEHLGDFYDRSEVTAVAFEEDGPLISETETIAARYGLIPA